MWFVWSPHLDAGSLTFLYRDQQLTAWPSLLTLHDLDLTFSWRWCTLGQVVQRTVGHLQFLTFSGGEQCFFFSSESVTLTLDLTSFWRWCTCREWGRLSRGTSLSTNQRRPECTRSACRSSWTKVPDLFSPRSRTELWPLLCLSLQKEKKYCLCK